MRRLVWAPRAQHDLFDIWRYFADVASPELADKLLREIAQASDRLAEHAYSERPRDEILAGLRSILVHPYVIFYRVTEAQVEIARVLHQRRDIPAAFAKENGQ